jgi:AGZA family xanthine/uracil permease-like MFS transporter
LLTEGFASIIAGLAGGVIQTTPYIGHPAYKAMGGRAAYTLATGLFIGIVGLGGGFTYIFEWLPRSVMFPILVFVGLEITAQSFRATPARHYPALGLAALPALAALALALFNEVHHGNPPAVLKVQTLRGLANGFIITSVLWATVLAMLLDGRLLAAALSLLAAAGCSLVGIIHSPLPEAPIAWPWDVMQKLPEAAKYQTPYHWAAAYGLAAMLVFALFSRDPKESAFERSPSGRG